MRIPDPVSLRSIAVLLLAAVCIGRAQPAAQATPPQNDPSAASNMTVAQLEAFVPTLHPLPDSEAARRLAAVVLTERLNGSRLASLHSALPGQESWLALTALADASVFCNPPPAEIPSAPTPDPEAQKRILALSVAWLAQALPRLPNLFATQNTTRYQRIPEAHRPADRLWRQVGTSGARVFYREGNEVQESGTRKGKEGLMTRGLFGPILRMVSTDSAPALAWDHWESNSSGLIAVYRYTVPEPSSHYAVSWRDPASEYRPAYEAIPRHITGYHGILAIDASTGTILRLSILADLNPEAPFRTSDVMVEYGPVTISGKTYICPLRSISFAVEHVTTMVGLASPMPGTVLQGNFAHAVAKPDLVKVNDVVFTDYHVFRAEVRMLPPGDLAPSPDN